MANVCMKFEKAGPNQTLVIDRTRLYKTDGRSDGQTGAKSSSSTGGGGVGGHNNYNNDTAASASSRTNLLLF